MSKAIGMIEFKTTSTGVTAADAMVKTSEPVSGSVHQFLLYSV